MTEESRDAPVGVGALTTGVLATVDARGRVAPEGGGWTLGWWLGTDDRWRDPAVEPAVRQSLLGGAPVLETRVRVPGGDARQRVWGLGVAGGCVVIEVENDSPAPFVLGLVARGGRARGPHRVSGDGTRTLLDDVVVLAARAPAAHLVGEPGSVVGGMMSGLAVTGPLPDRRGRRPVEVALLWPVAHRTRLRLVLVGAGSDVTGVDIDALAGADDAARGWAAVHARGVRVDIPDGSLITMIDAAKGALLLAGAARRPDPTVVAALEEWGFDTEVAAAWGRMGVRGQRRAARRTGPTSSWVDVDAWMRRASPVRTWPQGPAPFLLAVRAWLVSDVGEGVDLLTDLPPAWHGAPLAVHDVPTRAAGRVSYAVRWHGERPALLWECERAVRVRVPGLDPSWSSTERSGEALLAPSGGALAG